jgi:hypothetical protein
MSACIYLGTPYDIPPVDDSGSLRMTVAQAREAGLIGEGPLLDDLDDSDAAVLWMPSEAALDELTIQPLPIWPPDLAPQYPFGYEVRLRYTEDRSVRLLDVITASLASDEELTLWHLWLGDDTPLSGRERGVNQVLPADLAWLLDSSAPGFSWNRSLTITGE